MTDWSNLRDAYGSAAAVPEMIEAWARATNGGETLTDLRSHLAHQGTVYSASFASLPLLMDIASTHEGKKRRDAVMLASSIIASTDVQGDRPQERIAALLPDLTRLAEECLTHSVDDGEFVYLLEALAVTREDGIWGVELSHLVGEEFEGRCESCDRSLLFAIGSRGYFAAAEDYVAKPNTRRVPITPAHPGELPKEERWLEETAIAHGRPKVAQEIRYVFGTTHCPACDAPLSVDLSIKHLLRKMASDAK